MNNLLFKKILVNMTLSTMLISQNITLNNKFNQEIKVYNDIEYLNPNINEKYKKYIQEFINLVKEEYSEYNTSILYLNLKDLEVIEITKEQMEKKYPKRKAYYNIYQNKIYIEQIDNEESLKYVLFHELWHVFTITYVEENDQLIIPTLGTKYGLAIEEGMTSYLTNSICLDKYLSYKNQISIIELLVNIYGEEIVCKYLKNGVLGIKNEILKTTPKDVTEEILQLLDKDLQEKATNQEIIKIYTYFIDLYFANISNPDFSSILKFEKILLELDYKKEIKLEIMSYLRQKIGTIEIEDNIKYIIFNTEHGNKVYLLDNIYLVKVVNNELYFADTKIIKDYLKTGIIKQIYNDTKVYHKSPIIYKTIPLREIVKNNTINFVNVNNDKIYINTNNLEQKILIKH